MEHSNYELTPDQMDALDKVGNGELSSVLIKL